MDIGSAHISRKSTLFFFLTADAVCDLRGCSCIVLQDAFAHMDLIALDLRTGKRSKHTGQLTEMPLHPGPGFLFGKYRFHGKKSHSFHGTAIFNSMRVA